MKLVSKNDIRLRKPPNRVCLPLIEEDIKDIEQLKSIMYDSRGIGIAANQCGINKQIIIIDINWTETGIKNPLILLNPRIKEKSFDIFPSREGCLSCPGESYTIDRPKYIVVTYLNLDGKEMEIVAYESLLAACLGHEMDHLLGRLICDY